MQVIGDSIVGVPLLRRQNEEERIEMETLREEPELISSPVEHLTVQQKCAPLLAPQNVDNLHLNKVNGVIAQVSQPTRLSERERENEREKSLLGISPYRVRAHQAVLSPKRLQT